MADVSLQADVCIVGSGAAGGVLAYALTKAGFSVVVLEKGVPSPRDETASDELLKVVRRSHQPPVEADGTVVVERAGAAGKPTHVGQAFHLVGGGTVLYAATSWRLREADFEKRTRYGAVAGAELADWPIGYRDLEPWYGMAELEIGVSGAAGADPTEPARSADHLLPPLRMDPASARIEAAARGLGLRPFPIPTAISSRRNERNATFPCQYCGWCSGYTCLYFAKNSVDVTLLPKAAATGRLTLKTGASAVKVETDGRGKATGVIYREGPEAPEARVDAKVVCLAAGGIQTPRLLLLSADRAHPDGLANREGLVGRHLMFHIEGRRSGLFPEGFTFEMAKKIGVHDWYFPGPGDGYVNHCSVQSGSRRGPIRFAEGTPGWGAAWAARLADEFPRYQQLQAMVEDLPQAGNRVSLDPGRKDALGLPLPQVVHRYHEMDRAALVRTLVRMGTLLEAAGAELVDEAEAHTNVLGGYTYHLMGTCRMGTDPATSVVDPLCRTHPVKNLFVCDSSTFPTSAGLNPTLTIQANAFRIAAHLADRRGDYP